MLDIIEQCLLGYSSHSYSNTKINTPKQYKNKQLNIAPKIIVLNALMHSK